jgi:hypothetical protein
VTRQPSSIRDIPAVPGNAVTGREAASARGGPFRRFPLVSANALREFGLRSLTLRGQNRRRSVVRSLANDPGASGRERRALPPRQGECAMPFFRCFFVNKSVTPYFRRISSPTISKLRAGRRGAWIRGTGTKPSLPRPAGYGRRREDRVRPRKASRYGSAAAEASHYETDPQRIGGSVRPETR